MFKTKKEKIYKETDKLKKQEYKKYIEDICDTDRDYLITNKY